MQFYRVSLTDTLAERKLNLDYDVDYMHINSSKKDKRQDSHC